MERDRLKKRLKKQTLRNTLLVLFGIAILVVLLFTFGTQLLINFSLLLTRNGDETTNTTQDVSYIAPPDLNPVVSATNSASIEISGTSSVNDATIKLYVNDTLADSQEVTSKNEFTFKNVILEEGANEIKAKTVTKNKKESSFSSAQTVTYASKPPELTIDYPADGQSYKNDQQTVRGKTQPGASVTVNGFRAIVDSNGGFSYDIKLQQGGNSIKVVTIDTAGNKTEKEINVTFAP